MKKVLIVGVLLLGLSAISNASVMLVEDYQEAQVSIGVGEVDTFTIAEIGVSIDTSCYVQICAGGMVAKSKLWFEVDGDSLTPVVRKVGTTSQEWFDATYVFLLNPGSHTISLLFSNYQNITASSACNDAYLQALIFLPDAGGAIAEQPVGDVEPTEGMTSMISRGPYVTVTGATELVDATGRVIEGAIDEDRVSINNLSQGTYFARDGERTVVKIVKVD